VPTLPTSAAVTIESTYPGTVGNSACASIEDDDNVLGVPPQIVNPADEGGTLGATDTDVLGLTTPLNVQAFIEGSQYRIVVPLSRDASSHTISEAVTFGGTQGTGQYSGMASATNMQGAMWIFAMKCSYGSIVAGLSYGSPAVQLNKPYILFDWLPSYTNFHETEFCAACIEAAYESAQSDPSVPFHQQERVGLTNYAGGVDAQYSDIENAVKIGVSPITHNAAGVPMVHTCVTTCTALSDGTPSFELASPHKWYTAIFSRLFIVAARQAVTNTPASKKMTDGFTGKLKSATVDALQTLAAAPYQWLSASALAQQLKTILQAGASVSNLMRVVINTPLPTIEDYRGTDETIYLTLPTE
jgi:hypothetical protein